MSVPPIFNVEKCVHKSAKIGNILGFVVITDKYWNKSAKIGNIFIFRSKAKLTNIKILTCVSAEYIYC